jgi:hypothetical protein
MVRNLCWGEFVMPDAQTAALLRAILDELCCDIPPFDASTRTNVASQLLARVQQGSSSIEDLKRAGKVALRRPPTMWL